MFEDIEPPFRDSNLGPSRH